MDDQSKHRKQNVSHFRMYTYSKAVNRYAVFRPETSPQRVTGMSN